MTNTFRLTLVAAAAFAIGSPAFAQSFNPEIGTGNQQPFSYQPTANWSRTAVRHSGLHAYAMVPRGQSSRDANDPSLTGGASLGYNQNEHNY